MLSGTIQGHSAEDDLFSKQKLLRYKKLVSIISMERMCWVTVILSVAVCFAIRFSLDPWIGDKSPFLIFIAGVLISAVAAGFVGGVVATVLGLLLAWYVFLEPRYSFNLLSVGDTAQLIVFVIEALSASYLAGFFRKVTISVSKDFFATEEVVKDTSKQLSLARESENKFKDLSEAYLRSEQNFRLILDSIKGYGIFFFDNGGVINSWNEGARRLTGFTESEAIGKHISIIFTDDDVANGAPEFEMNTAREKGSATDERWHRRKSGAIFWGSGTVAPLKDSTGEIRGFVKVLSDATQVKEAQDMRAQQQAWLEASLNLLPVPMYFADAASGDIRFANKAFLDLSGEIPPSSRLPVGQKVFDESGKEIEFQNIPKSRAMRGEIVSDVQLKWYTKNDVRDVMVSAQPLPAMYGHPKTVVVTAIDVTHLKQVEADLKRANEAKSEFLANMSHEIRTPLGAILGFTDLINDPNLSNQEKSYYAEIISRNGKLLLQLINDILDLSKIESGNLQVEHISVSLPEMLRDVVTLFAPKAEAKGIKLYALPIHGEIPTEICSDPTRLKQILMNLISNAVKFTHRGEITIELGMFDCPTLKKPCLGFKVKDSGIGIPQDKQGQIFQPFMQADSSITRKYGGTGLGLVVSKKIAQALGGDLVLLESIPGQGSTFLATLNAIPAEMCPDHRHKNGLEKSKTSVEKRQRLKNASILLVEDSPDNQTLIKLYLTGEGANLQICDNGTDAIKIATEKTFDLILMDIQLPGVDGYTAMKELKRRGIRTPMIALTAHALTEERAKCEEAGCDGFLTKPIYKETLISEMTKVLSS